MMRKKIVSLCMALVLCLSLLPVTALAVGGAPSQLYVGNQQVSSGNDITYWTTDTSGGLVSASESDSWNVKYDPSTATLTLSGATIKGGSDVVSIPYGSGIYAQGSSNQPVTLTIELIGENTITGTFGIYVNATPPTTPGTDASLVIKKSGDNGSLTVTGTGNSGLHIISGTGDASLTIKNASVDAKTTQTYSSYAGVCVQSGASATDSPQLSLAVNGGSLTASGGGNNDGILFYVGASAAISATTSLTVTNNAIVDAKNGGISAKQISSPINTDISATGSNGGIVFDGTEGTVYGNVTLQEDLEIGEGESLTLDDGANLDAGGHNVIVDGGTLDEGLAESLDDSVIYKVTKVELNKTSLTLDVGNSDTLIAAITPDNATDKSVTWESSAPGVATVDTSGKVTAVAPGTATITVTTTDGGFTDTCQVTVTAATVPVSGVTLSQNQASLYYNRTPNTLTLTATVAPANATNQNVTWASSDPSVATVDAAGKVTAVAPGTATITATTVDGGFTAICTVTVRPDIPPANPNYRITVEATQGGAVTADPTAAKAGTTVTLTPVPDRGYQVGAVAVTDRFGDAVAVTEQADGTYTFTMPNGQVTVTVTFEQAPLPFPDVTEGDWFYDAVRYAYENGLMDGVGDNLFAPNSETTRAQLVTILHRLAGEPEPGGDSGFADVETGTWYTDAVAWAAENGIVNGVSDTEFAPGDDITREQLAAILYRYAACQGYDVSQRADLSGFGDASSISDYAQEALSWAHAQGLVLGFEDGSLRPQGTASRAQIAAVLMRFLAAVSAE